MRRFWQHLKRRPSAAAGPLRIGVPATKEAVFAKAETFIINVCQRHEQQHFGNEVTGDDDGERCGAHVGAVLGGHGQLLAQRHGLRFGGDRDRMAIRRRRHRHLRRQRHGPRAGPRGQAQGQRNRAEQRRLRAHQRDGQRDRAGGRHQHGHHQLAAGRRGRPDSDERHLRRAQGDAQERVLHPPEHPDGRHQRHAGLAVHHAGGQPRRRQDVHGAVRHRADARRPHQPVVGVAGFGRGRRHREGLGAPDAGVQRDGHGGAQHLGAAELRVHRLGVADGDQIREHVGEVRPHDRQCGDSERQARARRRSVGHDVRAVPENPPHPVRRCARIPPHSVVCILSRHQSFLYRCCVGVQSMSLLFDVIVQ